MKNHTIAILFAVCEALTAAELDPLHLKAIETQEAFFTEQLEAHGEDPKVLLDYADFLIEQERFELAGPIVRRLAYVKPDDPTVVGMNRCIDAVESLEGGHDLLAGILCSSYPLPTVALPELVPPLELPELQLPPEEAEAIDREVELEFNNRTEEVTTGVRKALADRNQYFPSTDEERRLDVAVRYLLAHDRNQARSVLLQIAKDYPNSPRPRLELLLLCLEQSDLGCSLAVRKDHLQHLSNYAEVRFGLKRLAEAQKSPPDQQQRLLDALNFDLREWRSQASLSYIEQGLAEVRADLDRMEGAGKPR